MQIESPQARERLILSRAGDGRQRCLLADLDQLAEAPDVVAVADVRGVDAVTEAAIAPAMPAPVAMPAAVAHVHPAAAVSPAAAMAGKRRGRRDREGAERSRGRESDGRHSELGHLC